MQTIKVDKQELIKKLQKNRKKHRAMFLRAQEVYREKMITELDRALDEAKNGGLIRRSFSLPVPEDHTEDFDTVIQMLEWDQGKRVELSQSEFRTYVENERIKGEYGQFRTLIVRFSQPIQNPSLDDAQLVAVEGATASFRFDRNVRRADLLVRQASERYSVEDVSLEDPDLESIIRRIYVEGYEERSEEDAS